MMRAATPRETPDFLTGGSEMGGLMRAMDWSTTSLGPVEAWPQSLRTTVSVCLNSRFPILLWWGRDLIMLYNDAYRPILGATKHPRALGAAGRDIWPEIWDIIGPMLTGVIERGEATWSDDLLLVLDRNGYPEECYFTFSYSPIRDESGGVGGVFTAVHETTGRVIGERRLRTLRELAAETAQVTTEKDIYASALDALARNPVDLPFALLYALDADGTTARLAGATGLPADSPAGPAAVSLAAADAAESAWPLRAVALSGEPCLVADLAQRFGPLSSGAWPDAPPTQAVVLPLGSPGPERATAFLVAGLNARRAFDDDYRGFCDLVARHVATALANARAYAAERERAEALAELDRAKTAFFSNVSHEFRTPLTLILGPLEDAVAETAEPGQRERLELMHRNTLRLQKLVNTLLDFSRIEAGRTQAAFAPTDLATLTADLASVFRSAVEKAGLRLVVDCPPLAEPVFVDHDMWEKIVLNLLSNAFKFTFEGEIAVSLRDSDGAVELVVRDTGTGIPAAELPHIFERFHRIQGSRARTYEGTGIGLALVRELVRIHGGSVRVASEAGRGAAFTVTIPTGAAHLPADRVGTAPQRTTALSAEHYLEEALRWLPNGTGSAAIPAPDDLAETGAAPTAPGPRARIIWADDNADMRAYVSRLLQPLYDVEAVPDGAAALAAAQRQTPDLVLADIMMPGLDGFGLLRALRGDEGTRTIPVILLSARAGEEARVEGLQAGADDYLIKPFSARELLARVQSHLQLAQVRRAASEALRQSEERFREMADNAPVMVWVQEPGGGFSFLSRSWLDFTGQTLAEALGHGWLEAVHPDDRPTVSASMAAAEAERRPFTIDYRLRRADGEYRWAIGAGKPRLGPHGEFLGYIGSVIDITERKRGELNAQFRVELDRRIAQMADADAIAAAGLSFLGQHLGLASCAMLELDPETGRPHAQYTWTTRDVGQAAPHDVAEFVPPSFRPRLAASETIAVDDVQRDERTAAVADHYARYDAGAFAVAPYVVGSELAAMLYVDAATPRSWRADELQLLGEVVARVWPAVERARAVAALGREQELLQTIIDRIPVMITMYDPEARLLWLNSEFERIVGWSSRAAAGVSLMEECYPDPALRARVAHHMQSGQGEWMDIPMRTRDGRTIETSWANVHLSDKTEIGIGIDITARKRAEATAQRQATLIELSHEPIFVWELDGGIIEWNAGAEGLYGFSAEEAIGRVSHDLLHTLHPLPLAELRLILQNGAQWAGELHQTTQDGREVIVASRQQLIEVDGRQLVLETNRDITEQKRAEAALREGDRRKDEFLATLAHELRNPLAPVRNAVQILKRQDALDPSSAAARDMIDRQVQHMVRLLDDLLDMSRITQDKLELRKEYTELAPILAQALETSRPHVEGDTHAVSVSVPQAPIYLDADPVRLVQVFSNLLNNASKYTQPGGQIWLAAERAGDDVVVSVKDTGAGIPPDKLDSVFDLFTQLERPAEQSRSGLGLGLTLVKRLVEMHGGSVAAYSEGVGRGSEFVVRLPVLAAPPQAEAAPPPAAANGKSRRILVVDDNYDIAESLTELLELEGHAARMAHDGLEAVAAAEEFRPDVVLLDIDLPRLDGYEAARRIRAQPWGQAMALVALTGWGQEEARRKSHAVGFDYHLVKPVDLADLLRLLATLPTPESNRPGP